MAKKKTRDHKALIIITIFVLILLGLVFYLKESSYTAPIQSRVNPSPHEVILDNSTLPANYKTSAKKALNLKCGYRITIPDNWKYEETPRIDQNGQVVDYTDCTFRPPNYDVKPPMPNYYGFWLGIKGNLIGRDPQTCKNGCKPVGVKNIDDLLKYYQVDPSLVRNKSYGPIQGKTYSFTYNSYPISTFRDGFEDPNPYLNTVFIFQRGNYIYEITWLDRYHFGLKDNKVLVRSSDDFSDEVNDIISSIQFN